jgi:hypothetical protein
MNNFEKKKRPTPEFMTLQAQLAKKIREKEGLKGVAEVAKRVKAVVAKAVGADWKEKGMTYVEALKKALAEY